MEPGDGMHGLTEGMKQKYTGKMGVVMLLGWFLG